MPNSHIRYFTGSDTPTILTFISPEAIITSNTLTNIPGLALPLTAGTWWFEAHIHEISSSGSDGAQFGIGYTGISSSLDCCVWN